MHCIKPFIRKWIVLNVILIFVLTTNCATYRNMRPTGQHITTKRAKVDEKYAFQLLRNPTGENPSLEVLFGSYPVYNEHRKIKHIGEKRNNKRLKLALYLLTGGAALIAISGENVLTDTLETTEAIGGSVLIVMGALALGTYFTTKKKWVPAEKYTSQEVIVKDEESFRPLSNTQVRVQIPTISKEWALNTDINGKVKVDLGSIASQIKDRTPLRLTFESFKPEKISQDFTIPSSVISEIKNPLKLTFERGIYHEGISVNKLRRGYTFDLEIAPQNISSIDAQNLSLKVSASKGIKLEKYSEFFSNIPAYSFGEKKYFRFHVEKNFYDDKAEFSIRFSRGTYSVLTERFHYSVIR